MSTRKKIGVSGAMIAEIRAASKLVKASPTIITESSPGVVLARARKNADRAIAIARQRAAR